MFTFEHIKKVIGHDDAQHFEFDAIISMFYQ